MTKAGTDVNFRSLTIDERHQYLSKLDYRVYAQEHNVKGLVEYAKSLYRELEDYRGKVDLSEQIVRDLADTGNDDVNSLTSMLRRYKRNLKYVQEEIEKLGKVIVVKDAEIENLSSELSSLHDYRSK